MNLGSTERDFATSAEALYRGRSCSSFNKVDSRNFSRSRRSEVDAAVGGLDKLEHVRGDNRVFREVDGIEMVWEAEADAPKVLETWTSHDVRGSGAKRRIGADEAGVVAVRIRWGDTTDAELGEAMERFAKLYRPDEKRCQEPERRGRGQATSWRGALDSRSAMGLASHP